MKIAAVHRTTFLFFKPEPNNLDNLTDGLFAVFEVALLPFFFTLLTTLINIHLYALQTDRRRRQ